MSRRVVANSEVLELELRVPPGHSHLRTIVRLADGNEWEFQEATVAALVRAFVRVKTDPLISGLHLKGRQLIRRKDGFAEWQLLEED